LIASPGSPAATTAKGSTKPEKVDISKNVDVRKELIADVTKHEADSQRDFG